MTEQEYINATNKAYVDSALEILQGIDLENSDEVINSYVRTSRSKLRNLSAIYDEMIIIEESE